MTVVVLPERRAGRPGPPGGYCHVEGGEGVSVCGLEVDEPQCCPPPCGRPRCPDCLREIGES